MEGIQRSLNYNARSRGRKGKPQAATVNNFLHWMLKLMM